MRWGDSDEAQQSVWSWHCVIFALTWKTQIGSSNPRVGNLLMCVAADTDWELGAYFQLGNVPTLKGKQQGTQWCSVD